MYDIHQVKLSGCAVPDWMLSIKQVFEGNHLYVFINLLSQIQTQFIYFHKLSTRNKKQLRRSAPNRRGINTSPL